MSLIEYNNEAIEISSFYFYLLIFYFCTMDIKVSNVI